MIETSARLLKLLTLLQTRRDWTGADLADRLGVSGRTIRNDIERLRTLGYPIEATRGVAGGYRLGAGAEMPPLLLDDDEAVAVAISLSTASDRGVAGIGEAGVRALAKLQQVLPSRLRHRVDALRAIALRVPTGEQSHVDVEVLQSLATASRQGEKVRIAYTRHDGERSRRIVEPHRLVNWDQRWYLVAWAEERRDWRTFRVDRISRVDPTGLRFAERDLPAPDVTEWVSRNVSRAGWRYEVTVTMHAPAEVVAARITPDVGRVEPVDEHRCLLHTGADELWWVAVYISALDLDFTIDGPPELIAHIGTLADRYERAIAHTSPSTRFEKGNTT